MGDSLAVLTLNVWGLKHVSKYRNERMRAIAKELYNSPQYDLICLQELWVVEDFDLIREKIYPNLPYAKFFYTGTLGSGLAIYSRFPILKSYTLPYPLSGRPLGFGDFYVNKAAGSVVVAHPVLGEVEVFSTHMYAGGPEGPEVGRSYRATHAWHLSKEILRAASQGRYAIACGDFNAVPDELAMDIMFDHGSVTDAWSATHPGIMEIARNGPASSAEAAMNEHGMTVDSPLNSWTLTKDIPEHIKRAFGKRLDYILFRDPMPSPSLLYPAKNNVDTPRLVCSKTEICMTGQVPDIPVSLSDHFGLSAQFTFVSPSTSTSKWEDPTQSPSTTIPNDPWASARSATNPLSDSANGSGSVSSSDPLVYNSSTLNRNTQTKKTLTSFYDLLGYHQKIHTKHAQQLLILFPSAVAFFVGLVIATAFLPRSYYTPIFVFASGLAGFGACVALVTGFVWGRKELGGLKSLREEVEEELTRIDQ